MSKRRQKRLRKQLQEMLNDGEVTVKDGVVVLTDVGEQRMIEFCNNTLNHVLGVVVDD
jgi:hypothetical protein